MSDFDPIRDGCVTGVTCLSVTAPHARKGEAVEPSHPSHSSTDINAELGERLTARIEETVRRRNARAETRRQLKRARDAGLVQRHARKEAR